MLRGSVTACNVPCGSPEGWIRLDISLGGREEDHHLLPSPLLPPREEQSVRNSRADVVGPQELRHLLDCDDVVVVATSQQSSVERVAVGRVSPQTTTSYRCSIHLPSWIHYYFLQQPRWTMDMAAEADVMMVVVVHYM